MENNDPRPPIAVAYEWVGRVFAVCIEMIAPGIAGIWLDERLGTSFLVIVGFGLGIVLAVYHLIAMANQDQKPRNTQDDDKQS